MENQSGKQSLISEDTEITGNIRCSSTIEVKGKLTGDLECASNVVLGETSVVKGNLNVATIAVFGQVTGNISASDKIELKSTARVHGDIKSKRLTVEDGVTFMGKSEVSPSGKSGSVAPPPAAQVEDELEDSDSSDRGKKGLFNK